MILLIAVIRVNCAAATTGTYIYGKYVVSHIALQSDFNQVFQDKGAVFQLSRRWKFNRRGGVRVVLLPAVVVVLVTTFLSLHFYYYTLNIKMMWLLLLCLAS